MSIVSASCSFVEFERSPYAPRDVEIVYSAQEDITFFTWRISEEANLDRVEFDIHVDGSYRRANLEQTFFPHEPYLCGEDERCLQYQVAGHWSPSEPSAPIRALDSRHGRFDSSPPTMHEVDETYTIDPVAIDNNTEAKPRLYDWFDDQDIPLQRSFSWTLTDSPTDEDGNCPEPSAGGWSELTQKRVVLPQEWMSATPCMAVRPEITGMPATEVRRSLEKSAMLYREDIDQPIPEIKHPTLVAFLVDLEIPSDSRCSSAIDAIRDEIFDALGERETPYRDLGTYAPVDNQGNELSPCDQTEGPRYPVDQILVQADQEAATFEDTSTLLVVYLNNLDLPPSEIQTQDLASLFDEQHSAADTPRTFTWSIGSNTINQHFDWDATTPWAPIEDQNFVRSIESLVHAVFPLRSTQPEGQDAITLTAPRGSEDPQYFRLCSISPQPSEVERPPLAREDWNAGDHRTWEWAAAGNPTLYFELHRQAFRPYGEFRDQRVAGIYEVCDQFCDNAFMASNDIIYDSWFEAEGVCRWQ